MVSLSEQRRLDNVKKSQATGAATRAANVARAGEQERIARAKGGRFRDGSTITTVTPTGGKAFSVNFKENLSFSEGVRVESRPIESKQNRITETSVKTEEQKFNEDIQKSESGFNQFSEQGEVSAPPQFLKMVLRDYQGI